MFGVYVSVMLLITAMPPAK